MIIRLKVFEQTLSVVDTKSVPRKGSKDYLVLQFTFSSDWKDLDKLCYLQRGEVSQPIDVVNGLVEVPEWFTQQDSFDVTLFGKGGSQEVPTNVVSLRLEKSNTLWEQDAPEPQPSWLAKVIDLNNHPPIPGDNGYWLVWDTDSGAYVESELPLPAVSVGPQGPKGDTGPQGPKGDTGAAGADGKSAYASAQDGGYTGTEAEFAEKLARDKFANPNALTFTGAVTGTYDGSEALMVDIPSGGGSISLPLLYDLTTSEEVRWIDTGDNAFLAKNFLFVDLISIATATNESDADGSASMYPLRSIAMQCPWNNEVVARQISALMPKNYTKVFGAFCFRGDGGHWTSIASIRNDVNYTYVTPSMLLARMEGTSDQPMRGLIIGNAKANSTNVLGVGSRLRVWGI